MNDALKRWWQTRTLREQRLLLTMSALLALVLIWLLVVRPLGDALSAARERHTAAVLALAEVRAQAAAIASADSAPAVNLGMPLDGFLNNAAREAGFPVTQVAREGVNQATVEISAARPQALFGWVGQMEARGLTVERLSATANADQTISVRATFSARSG